MRVQEALKKLREDAGLNKNQLAVLLNIGGSQVNFYESGKRKPSIMTLVKYAKFAMKEGIEFDLENLEE